MLIFEQLKLFLKIVGVQFVFHIINI